MHSLKQAAAGGATSVTFGGGASPKLTPGRNLKGTRFKVLSKAYHAIATELKLTNKTEFRTKLGAQDDPVFGKFFTVSARLLAFPNKLLVCYPPHGLGPAGARAVISFFEDDEETSKA
jgi:aspartyl-tRNA synthetase